MTANEKQILEIGEQSKLVFYCKNLILGGWENEKMNNQKLFLVPCSPLYEYTNCQNTRW